MVRGYLLPRDSSPIALCTDVNIGREMSDEDGPELAETMYSKLLEDDEYHMPGTRVMTVDDIPYRLDEMAQRMCRQGLPASRWAPFVHFGM